MMRYFFLSVFLVPLLCCCSKNTENTNNRTLYLAAGGKIKTLDPALASDLASRNMAGVLYDTLLQYDYRARPYRLIPSMLAKMPEVSSDLKTYKFTLRDDLYFQKDKCFGPGAGKKQRKISSKDVVFSFLRIADGRLHSPVFWMFRGKIKGIDQFRRQTASAAATDMDMYNKAIAGFEIIDELNFVINLKKPDSRFLYALAIPYASIVSKDAVMCYGKNFAEHPVGSGPFKLTEWIRDYRIKLARNPEYRPEFYPHAASKDDSRRRLPLLDNIVCYIVKQPISSWLLFLQGEIDISALSKDNFDIVVSGGETLSPALKKRGISLIRNPQFEVIYLGFNFDDPVLSDNLRLRKAISLAYNVGERIKAFNNQLIAAQSAIPPGVAGYDSEFINQYSAYNLKKAKLLMAAAGYPNGIDPKSGKNLTLTFDLPGASPLHRQVGEMTARDLAKIGIEVKIILNNKPRFLQKIRKGDFQLFRLSWIGDYPDAENFLQLFYSKNAGSCNRAKFKDPKFDKMFEKIISMPNTPQRTMLYRRMDRYLTGRCPWIFESFPVSWLLLHSWVENYIPHDFAFSRWKYLAVDAAKRQKMKKSFTPIDMKDLRK